MLFFFFLFFKQKTAYELRISDWSSDVCSSDLVVSVFALITLIVIALMLVLIPMLAKQLMRLYELAPQMLDWLQHTAVPWVQSRLGLAEGFWKFDKVKAAISEHMGQTSDIVGVVLSQATASGQIGRAAGRERGGP